MIAIYVEKKSAAASIAFALKAGEFIKVKNLTQKKLGILGYWSFSWRQHQTYILYGVGHLTGLCDAVDYDAKFKNWNLVDYPCLPERFVTKPSTDTLDYFNFVADILSKADMIISATDPDREGQVVFDYLYRTIGIKTEYYRAWLPSDLTPPKIIKAFNELETWDKHYPLTLAGIARSIADWTIGCNLTVAATLKYGGKVVMNVGRVQTAVLNLVVERTRRIESFEKQPFWRIIVNCSTTKGLQFEATMQDSCRFSSEQDAQAVLQTLIGLSKTTIKDISIRNKKIKKPLLFSTTELQIAAHSKYGYDVKKIAEIMESLYNEHYITYPRTEANVISSMMETEVKNCIANLLSLTEYNKYYKESHEWSEFTSRHINDDMIAKTGDSHTAIIPTLKIPSAGALSEEQKNIYDMIAKSILCLVYDDVDVDETTICFDIANYSFKATGTVIKNYDDSWYFLMKEEKNTTLPPLIIGEEINVTPKIVKGETKPEPYFTQSSLLKQMMFVGNIIDDEDIAAFMKSKECGLGTGGTRPEIISGLIKNQLLFLDGKKIVPSSKGYWLIDHLPDQLKMLKDAKTTGIWEQRLNQISISNLSEAKKLTATFLKNINLATRQYFSIINQSPTAFFSDTHDAKVIDGSIYSCPKCGSPLHRFNWGFGCTSYKNGCDFSLGKFRNKKLTDKQMIDLLTKGKTGIITLKNKEGVPYKGFLYIDQSRNIAFDFTNNKKGENRGKIK